MKENKLSREEMLAKWVGRLVKDMKTALTHPLGFYPNDTVIDNLIEIKKLIKATEPSEEWIEERASGLLTIRPKAGTSRMETAKDFIRNLAKEVSTRPKDKLGWLKQLIKNMKDSLKEGRRFYPNDRDVDNLSQIYDELKEKK